MKTQIHCVRQNRLLIKTELGGFGDLLGVGPSRPEACPVWFLVKAGVKACSRTNRMWGGYADGLVWGTLMHAWDHLG